jgi:hypothetical protein
VSVVAVATRRTLPVAGTALLALLVGGQLARDPSSVRLITAACIGICACIAATQWPDRAVVAMLLLLPFLALSRRLLLDFTGWDSTDPLLLVAPAVLGMVLLRLFVLEQRELARDGTSKLVLIVIALTLLQVANPRGGGLVAGVGALLFTAVPLSWYFVGRELARPRLLRTLFSALVVAAGLVAVYGLNQTWRGLPTWDQEWIRQTGYAALYIGDVIRPFGTLSSAAEYAHLLGIGTVVSIAFAVRGHFHLVPALPLLAVALFYASARAVVATTLFAVIVVLAARTGSMRRAVLAVVACTVGFVLAFTFARGTLQETAASSSDPLVSHQLAGLADPFNEDTSTLSMHLTMFQEGIRSGLLDPFGHGITSTTLAGAEFGSEEAASTEVDVSNAFVGLGTVGGLAYLALVIVVFRAALIVAVHRSDAVSLAVLGTLVVALGQWLNGGFYAVSPLIWFIAGFVVACRQAER